MRSVRFWRPCDRGERHQLRAIRPEGRSRPGRPLGPQLADGGIMEGRADAAELAAARQNAPVRTAEHNPGASIEGTRHTLSYGQYRLAYEVYGSGDRVLVWLHGLLLDANLSRGLAPALAPRGHRVVLLDLLGHGRSDKPRHAGSHRIDLYAQQVLCLLDELGVDQVVLGGFSLGTNVSLITAVEAPERVRGLILEMPVLEWAVPAAALAFLPLLLWVHYARPCVRLGPRAGPRRPLSGLGPLQSFINPALSHPHQTPAVF